MKMLILKFFFVLIVFTSTSYANDIFISASELPQEAQTFLSVHFANNPVHLVEKDKNLFSSDYEVSFINGTEIEFDSKGIWKKIDGNGNKIPDSVISPIILNYVSTNYYQQHIDKIEKERWGYDIKLNNRLELEFDLNGKFLKIDR